MADTARCYWAFFSSLFLTFLAMPFFIKWLRARRLEQIFRARGEVRELADLHASKLHTPTMGGIVIWATTCISSLVHCHCNVLVWATLATFTGFAAIGFADDFAKIKGRSSRGIRGRKKLLVQGLLIVAVLLCIWASCRGFFTVLHELWIPVKSTPLIGHMPTIFLFAFAFLVIAGSANAVNLTDGADGLACGCAIIVAITLLILCADVSHAPQRSLCGWLSGRDENLAVQELAVVLSALTGSLGAFLWFNAHPAQIFMGDTGSLAIGGLFGIVAFLIRQPFALAIVGCVFVLEALSVISQVYYFKFTGGRRIFRMAPLHHHFELGGWPEPAMVTRFWILSLIGAGITLLCQ
ncbi:MAG: phospho-N-acetylmuramoyl-pentapeptide-transferase [Puniceicoccales bacterium]|nr:phospho-N-acetylmuramoyl-pentapeptide-transferase [Puniceicoccales bacterium]